MFPISSQLSHLISNKTSHARNIYISSWEKKFKKFQFELVCKTNDEIIDSMTCSNVFEFERCLFYMCLTFSVSTLKYGERLYNNACGASNANWRLLTAVCGPTQLARLLRLVHHWPVDRLTVNPWHNWAYTFRKKNMNLKNCLNVWIIFFLE